LLILIRPTTLLLEAFSLLMILQKRQCLRSWNNFSWCPVVVEKSVHFGTAEENTSIHCLKSDMFGALYKYLGLFFNLK